ncbi:type II toxin-antitoxin system HicB family antitoxin [Shewanella sp. JM162201]|uniref:Type II toxin-antitoxin system HicB family antitoxin n=1 Tax=Shewanella jiangmenensis TaxID=2837387 RepID=A0ABS5V6V0_9GAMM|nr:type II toxin-antitoxin system HicB family antitoxin [Shewanella jiangmenensis]MBT1446169.1 type II toxin-antitoxin system HicB family antitoxin [Shewanella jiangmenensis]
MYRHYPIAIQAGSDDCAYCVIFPDLKGCYSAGDSYAEALSEAKAALEMHLESLADTGETPPPASEIDELIHLAEYRGHHWALLEVDLTPYLGGSEKKNVTLPSLVLKKIDNLVAQEPAYKDRSNFLLIAAMNELQKHRGV